MGEDRESVEKTSRQAKEEDEKALLQQIKTDDGVKRILDKLLGRRKAKRSYEYEVCLLFSWSANAVNRELLGLSHAGRVCKLRLRCWHAVRAQAQQAALLCA